MAALTCGTPTVYYQRGDTWVQSSTSNQTIVWDDCTDGTTAATWGDYAFQNVITKYELPAVMPHGKEMMLPDGSKLIVDDLGNHRIEDSDAKVTYKSNRIREFSPHINASDMLSQFVEQAAAMGVKRDEVMELPLHLFVAWLIIEAAERDGDTVPGDVVPLGKSLSVIKHPRCLECNKFVPKVRKRFPFCNTLHAQRYLETVA
jgi:hypothetical protein